MEHTLKNAPGFVRDEKSGAVINTNTDGYNIILEKRKHAEEMSSIMKKLQEQEEMLKKIVKVLK